MIKSKPSRVCWTYMVECKYGTYYTGWTNDLTKRIAAHNAGKGAKYLRGKGPVKLVYKKKFLARQKAQDHERFIKALSRYEKESIIAGKVK